MWISAKTRAIKRGLEFSIPLDAIVIPERCPILGMTLNTGMHDARPSLDRVDVRHGYIPGNIDVISLRANRLKDNATVEELRLILAYVEARL